MQLINKYGCFEHSRVGDVLVLPYPVLTVYECPDERILFHPGRDANPWFHIMESMWMLLGRSDVNFLAFYNKRMLLFSDDGNKLSGAYGYRWRYHFNRDQLTTAIRILRDDPSSRRVVIQMWDSVDLDNKSLDVPCNTHIYLRIMAGGLDMTVMCRSNDIVWGAYGANAVHFSVLQEYLAASIGVEIGKLYQFSHNFHAYKDVFNEKWETINEPSRRYDSKLGPTPLVAHPGVFMNELRGTMEWIENLNDELELMALPEMGNPFMYTLMSMAESWLRYKQGDIYTAITIVDEMPDTDWKLACQLWLNRRLRRGQRINLSTRR